MHIYVKSKNGKRKGGLVLTSDRRSRQQKNMKYLGEVKEIHDSYYLLNNGRKIYILSRGSA